MRGFTLIELIACIVILAILAALAGPRFVGTQSFDQRGYADELTAAMRYAEGVAVATGCNVSFTVNLTGYVADQRAPAAGNTCAAAGAYATAVVRADGTALSGTAPSDATVSAGGTVIFGSSGQVTNPPAPSFVIGSFTLSIDPVSGFISEQ
jgi:MSHA pilin protein MshC